MTRSLIIGGTRGLGLALARESLRLGVEPIVTGQTKRQNFKIDGVAVRCEAMSVENDESVGGCIDLFKVQPSLDFKYVFFCAGKRLQGRFCKQSLAEVSRNIRIKQDGLMNVVRHFHQMKKKPYHLIAIASTTAYKLRNNEAAYGAANAGMVQFARNFHQELAADLPGSKTLIAFPGGMRTEFWDGSGVNTSKFFDPADVAKQIWSDIVVQEMGGYPALHELTMARNEDGTMRFLRGPQLPYPVPG